MPRIAGISTEKDYKGNIRKVTFDMKKHGATLQPVLEKLGVVEEDEFEKKWRTGITIEESRQKMYKIIEEQWKDK